MTNMAKNMQNMNPPPLLIYQKIKNMQKFKKYAIFGKSK
jgi:hypothetical protein